MMIKMIEVLKVSSDDDEETRTNVREKSSGDDELENYSEFVQASNQSINRKPRKASC